MNAPEWIHQNRSFLAFLAVLVVLTGWYLGGIPTVPFHPDESTQLFMSADIERLANNPADLIWKPERENEPVRRYHLLDAPLTRYAIGLARQFAGLAPLPVDWDWGKTWAENEQAGAVPSAQLLLTSRLAVALAYPLSVLALYLTARRAANDFTAWSAGLLLATNGLMLLHTRRAMAESLLVLSLTLTLLALVYLERRRWLAGLPAALAFCAKQSLAALAPVGLLAVLWLPEHAEEKRKDRVGLVQQVGLYAVTFGLVVFLLNPFLWRQPWQAGMAAVRARQVLAGAQTGDRPWQTLDTPGLRLVGLIGGLYLTPPIFHETGNYVAETQAAEMAYLANPFNHLLSSIPAGGVLFLLGLAGFGLACRTALRRAVEVQARAKQRRLALLLLASLLQALFLLATIRLPWQRYYMPLVPLACLWAAYGLDQLRSGLIRVLKTK